MNIQAIIIVILFIAAVFYVARMLYNTVTAKKSCGSNCKCGVDFSAIEPQKQAK
ncbi:FeoB-associated Cys-rich membrane protein [Mucilaginibacter psychrotolerans]|uniref:FeoB-associated Cys-rich membrane protein n=1 Tax=Mucilaginibacter psychrotolerans TaxID=1524096 RepID=A0A4Y8S642_9SPHI|nr:FeoB-associated Cys-rich membrane protein [Mucilaginibacter psychrotolerans]TFF34206.1 FeoB-associated Cys-rich membrane protein [Mucilaginibacter psychrotolerans]